jgi:hypothetical protein
MKIDRRCKQFLSTLFKLLVLCILLGPFSAIPATALAQPVENPLAGQTDENTSSGSISAATFHFNDLYTTPFGPAYADIWVAQQNFLACRPPVGRAFSYALCYFSGPATDTPVPSDGSQPVNPPLPCILSQDGKSANCTCYEINTEQYPPVVPYFVNINAILNLDLYLRTIAACGHDGGLCSPQAPVSGHMWWNAAPACRAVNTNTVIPTAELISVFSTVKNSDYATGVTPNSTSCPGGKYAGCMTAPCHHTGKADSAGNELVECKCPVYDGPFELGQAGVPCDANDLPAATAGAAPRQDLTYIWSAAHNPNLRDGPIDPPTTGCLPDVPGDKACPLYSPSTQYPIATGSPLCQRVCAAYRNDISQDTSGSPSNIQVGYSCDAALCTTLGNGQSAPPPNPLAKANLLQNACGGLEKQSGLRAILALEQIDQCSCCASQVCGCANAVIDIDPATQAEIAKLNAQQEQLEITPQCQINGTLCGAASPLVAAVLPSSRSVQVSNTATAFATIINSGSSAVSGCAIVPVTTVPASFVYQTTNPATNALTGSPNTRVSIAAVASQSFVIAFTPNAPFAPTIVMLSFDCTGVSAAPSNTGLNTLLLSASTLPVPDTVALAATAQNDGILHISGTTGSNAFAIATVNVGASASITATATTGAATLPLRISLCQTDPMSGQCISSIGPSVTTTIETNATPTFAIFATASGAVPFLPQTNRIFVEFSDANEVVRGSASVAVETQ